MMILKAPNEKLRIVCQRVNPTFISKSDLPSHMVQTMLDYGGKGLAAPQVGYSLRVICMMYKNKPLVMYNPEIVRRGKEIVRSTEGCLSMVKGFNVTVKRNKIVTVKFKDRNLNTIEMKMTGIDAFCVQHEIDHLDGILIGD